MERLGSFDDLLYTREERTVPRDEFETLSSESPYTVGWAVGSVVLDREGRVLLVYHGGDDHWVAPGGSVESGESLRQAVVREVREETGVIVRPVRPHAVLENAVTCGEDVDTFRFVLYRSEPLSTETGTDLGEPGEPIERARWFRRLPSDVFGRDILESVLDRIRDRDRSR